MLLYSNFAVIPKLYLVDVYREQDGENTVSHLWILTINVKSMFSGALRFSLESFFY